MSISLLAEKLRKVPSVEEFKKLLTEKAKENLKEEWHNLEFIHEDEDSLWTGVKGQYSRGCWFYFGNDGVCATTHFGRNAADVVLQEVGICELVKKYGEMVVEDDCMTSWTFNRKTNRWDKDVD